MSDPLIHRGEAVLPISDRVAPMRNTLDYRRDRNVHTRARDDHSLVSQDFRDCGHESHA